MHAGAGKAPRRPRRPPRHPRGRPPASRPVRFERRPPLARPRPRNRGTSPRRPVPAVATVPPTTALRARSRPGPAPPCRLRHPAPPCRPRPPARPPPPVGPGSRSRARAAPAPAARPTCRLAAGRVRHGGFSSSRARRAGRCPATRRIADRRSAPRRATTFGAAWPIVQPALRRRRSAGYPSAEPATHVSAVVRTRCTPREPAPAVSAAAASEENRDRGAARRRPRPRRRPLPSAPRGRGTPDGPGAVGPRADRTWPEAQDPASGENAIPRTN